MIFKSRMIHLIDFFFPFRLVRKLTFFDSGGDQPDPPDYVGAAKAQGEANLQAAKQTGIMNNPNVNNPFGSQKVTWAPVKNKAGTVIGWQPSIKQEFSPEQQKLFQSSLAAKQNLANAGIAGSKNIAGLIGSNLNLSGLPDANAPGAASMPALRDLSFQRSQQQNFGNLSSAQRYRDEALKAMMGRVDTDIAGQRDQSRSELIASGIRPGTKAYASAMDQIDRRRNDALNQAILSSGQEAARFQGMDQNAINQRIANFQANRQAVGQDFSMDQAAQQQKMSNYQNYRNMLAQDFNMNQQARQQALAELMTRRQTPLNEINAIISGSQVNNPFAGGLGYNGAGNVQAAPIANAIANQGQAEMNQYNAQQAALNGNINAGVGLLGSLGSAWLSR